MGWKEKFLIDMNPFPPKLQFLMFQTFRYLINLRNIFFSSIYQNFPTDPKLTFVDRKQRCQLVFLSSNLGIFCYIKKLKFYCLKHCDVVNTSIAVDVFKMEIFKFFVPSFIGFKFLFRLVFKI